MHPPKQAEQASGRASRSVIACALLIGAVWSPCSNAEVTSKPAAPATRAATARVVAPAASCDVERGKRVYAKCAICHARDKNAPSPAGPNLYGVVNRLAGRAPGFHYSRAMANYGKAWTVAELDRYLTKPAAVVPGTSMAFAGLAKRDDRAALICLLQQAK
jgi:cytochrome c